MTSSWQTQPPQELLHRFTSVQDQIQQYGFRLRSDKCTFFQTSVKYLGFIFDKKSQRLDPENIHSIKNMSAPTDVSTLRSFLRPLSHYDSFSYQNCASYVDLLKSFFKLHTKWNWSSTRKESFEKIKSLLSSAYTLWPIRRHYCGVSCFRLGIRSSDITCFSWRERKGYCAHIEIIDTHCA